MLDVPLDLLGLIALLAGGAAWILAGVLNKWMEPSLPTESASRIKAFVSLAVLVTCALIGFWVLNAIRHTAGDEKGFFAMLVAAFAAQKAFFLTTDSLIGLEGMGIGERAKPPDAPL
jgi:peptidoglycan biosynthesis protein MviN/MurJ (putative lipid II flippase)